MSDDLKDAYKQEMPPGLRERLTRGAEPLLERNAKNAERPSLLSWLFRPLPAAGLATGMAALAIAIMFTREKIGQPPHLQELAYDLTMVRDAELLLDLEVLQNLDKLEERRMKKKWQKKKS